jgi:V/A-type H+-transporting ATPase subunit F
MDVVVIGDRTTVTGFRLAGIKRTIDAGDGNVALQEVLDDSSVGVVVITERIADKHRETLLRMGREKKGLAPIVVEIPDLTGPVKREKDPIKELIRRALGAEIEEEEV